MNNRTAVVIGGATGIGWATANALAADGCTVLIAGRDGERARRQAAELGEGHRGAQVDVVDEASVQRLFDSVDRLDYAVNCAGFGLMGSVVDMPAEQFRDVVDVCLNGAFIVLKHAGRTVVDGGSLVSVTSINARQPATGMSAYCAAKAGVVMLTQVAALELGPRGVRVNAVSPGLVPTAMTEAVTAVPTIANDYLANTALGRLGTPEDIASAIRFLCSDQSAWMTGEVLDLNGGAHLKRYPDMLAYMTGAASL
ncbi:SDR family NAD(P)-dependent oxidoreductase [Mycobacterium sp. 94-17]|uniref:SDR family NAD(P)-dependent oxidoreductase n=1 Tax=Mycobacterium sp. 94-17 TaxID=2986147 RepID=UPI002D1F6074|nr:SDR family NAD(P)-dependent oxidoreductase [Mycobacterium sp. 94-17]MEB4209781.1 SDR family NAD(P)-dependent oxidoreductase [Mycobacterium sp. 94-17]